MNERLCVFCHKETSFDCVAVNNLSEKQHFKYLPAHSSACFDCYIEESTKNLFREYFDELYA